MAKCKCDNCGYKCEQSELNEAKNLDSRLDYPIGHPKCIEPDGECPKCGCLSYEMQTEKKSEKKAEKKAEKLAEKQAEKQTRLSE